MNELKVADKTWKPLAVTAVSQEKAAETIQALRKNGADDVLVKVGDDLVLASGRGMAVDRVKVGTSATVNGKLGQVVAVNAERNTYVEGIKHWLGPVVAVLPLVFGLFNNARAFRVLWVFVTVPVGAAINYASGVHAERRKIDLIPTGQ